MQYSFGFIHIFIILIRGVLFGFKILIEYPLFLFLAECRRVDYRIIHTIQNIGGIGGVTPISSISLISSSVILSISFIALWCNPYHHG